MAMRRALGNQGSTRCSVAIKERSKPLVEVRGPTVDGVPSSGQKQGQAGVEQAGPRAADRSLAGT
jgi:hypothetical protein